MKVSIGIHLIKITFKRSLWEALIDNWRPPFDIIRRTSELDVNVDNIQGYQFIIAEQDTAKIMEVYDYEWMDSKGYSDYLCGWPYRHQGSYYSCIPKDRVSALHCSSGTQHPEICGG